MDQYPYSIPPVAAASTYPYPDGPPDKAPSNVPPGVAEAAGVVAQVPQNPYYLGDAVPAGDSQTAFTGGYEQAPEVSIPNGMVQPGYGSYFPEQVPQQQQQQLGEEPVQYSQQDYAREANVPPVEYLPEGGLAVGQESASSIEQQIGQSTVAAEIATPVFNDPVETGLDLQTAPQSVVPGESGTGVDVNQEQPVGTESTPNTTEANQLPTLPTAPESTESAPPTDAVSSAADTVEPTVETESTTVTDVATPQIGTDADPEAPIELPSEDPPKDDDHTITSPTPRISELCFSSTKKKRRRIVQLNDDDDSDDDDGQMDRLELLRSPEPPAEVTDGVANSSGDQLDDHGKIGDGGDGIGNALDGEGEDGDGRPESRGSSGRGAPSIFQNVVMIAAADSEAHKRKKIRVLDSDDDEEDQQVATTVDDIGLTGDDGDELNPGGVIDDNAEDGEFGEGLEQIVAMDAPIIDPSQMLEEDDEEDNASEKSKDKEGSDREVNGSDVEEPAVEEEEEEEAEEGVEMITAEDDAGEAIGIATDDETELVEEEAASTQNSERGSDQEAASEVEGSDAEASESRSAAGSPAEDQENSQESGSDQRRSESEAEASEPEEGGKKADSGDEVVCQNDLELNTISLLTDEEDDNHTPLPPPKKELPVVRIVNIKKELLDDRVKKERYDPTSYYQQQHYIKQQQLAQRKKEKKKKKERNFDNNDPFGAWSSSSSDDEFIPNDIYFGTPDRVFTASTKIRCQKQKQLNERYSAKYGRPSKSGKRRYSDDSDGEDRRKRKQKLDQVARLNLPSYQQAQLQSMIKKKKKKRQDRFYDKSQDIPNDIYFGNVNVPLHILYAFGDSSSDDERNRANTSWRPVSGSSSSKSSKYQSSSGSRGPYRTSASSSSYGSSVSPSSDRSVQAMKEYLKIAGFKNVKFHKLWEGCKSNQERANAILRLMQDKGLEGEPTIAKCRELRKQLQMEREAQVLDTSLIIDSGEGRITRRSARNPRNHDSLDPSEPSTSGTSVLPESSEAMNRFRSFIDPDSDGE